MGSFRQHITCSTVTGIALGGIGIVAGVPLPVCLVSAGLCSAAGMLPDIDSDTSRSFQECIYLAAGLGAILLVQRLRYYQLDHDIILFAGAAMFFFIRFGVGWFIKKMTAHRGMIHSIPMALLSGEITFLLATGTMTERLIKASAMIAGFLSHLILDEVFSIDSTGHLFKPFRLKRSFGTALKFSDTKRKFSTLAIYAITGLLGYMVFGEMSGHLNFNAGAEYANQDQLAPTEQIPQISQLPRIAQSNTASNITSNTAFNPVPSNVPHSNLQPLRKTADHELALFAKPAEPQIADQYVPPQPPAAQLSSLPTAMEFDNQYIPQRTAQPAPIILP